jgi:hypothetical protein
VLSKHNINSAIRILGINSLLFGITSTAPALADYNPKEWAKYFNPLPQKQYLNKSQDRAIKKKAFKTNDDLTRAPIPNKEVGIFAKVSTADLKDYEALQKLLDDKRVSGLSVLIPWTVLEPSEEKYDWKPLDDLLSLCQKSNKSLIVRVSTCGLEASEANSDTPEWLYAAGVKSIMYKDKDGKEHKMPIFWDETYLARWSNFVTALGARYDKNPTIHSVGITGGGMLGGTQVVPDFLHDKDNYAALENELIKNHGMSQRQLVTHWKYVADLFPKAFPNTSLNFAINPPTPNRAGQDTLDEISDYLVFRYGQRVYLTRQNVSDGKHGFDEYRIILKFKNDTYTGYELTSDVDASDWKGLAKNALDDGVSFVEIPKQYLKDDAPQVKESLDRLQAHLGYQLIVQTAQINHTLKSGEPITASLAFINTGSAAPKTSRRELDKDVPASYQIGFEVKDKSGQPLMISVQTPKTPTTRWVGNKPIVWEDEYRLADLKPGEYLVDLCVIDKQTKRKLQILDGTEGYEKGTAKIGAEVALGKINVQ